MCSRQHISTISKLNPFRDSTLSAHCITVLNIHNPVSEEIPPRRHMKWATLFILNLHPMLLHFYEEITFWHLSCQVSSESHIFNEITSHSSVLMNIYPIILFVSLVIQVPIPRCPPNELYLTFLHTNVSSSQERQIVVRMQDVVTPIPW